MALPPDPTELMFFAHVVSAGGFSEAAKKTGIPKSTLSRRIAELEGRLGEKLLQRTSRRVVLTELGQRVFGAAEQIVQEVERVAEVAEHRRATPSGRLRISAPADLAGILLAPMLSGFARDYPEVQLDLDLSPHYVDVIAEGFDLVIRVGDGETPQQLTTRHLIDLDLGLYAAPAYLERRAAPLSPRDLPGLDLLALVSNGSPLPWHLERRGEQSTIDMATRRLAANSYDLLGLMARGGLGLSILPDLFAAPGLRQGALRRVLPDWQISPVTVRAVFPSRRLMPHKTRVFLDGLLRYVKQIRGGEAGLVEAYSLMSGGPQRETMP